MQSLLKEINEQRALIIATSHKLRNARTETQRTLTETLLREQKNNLRAMRSLMRTRLNSAIAAKESFA